MRTTVRKPADVRSAVADVLVVAVGEGDGPLEGPAAEVDEALAGAVRAALADRELERSAGSSLRMRTGGALRAPRVVVVGAGARTAEDWRAAGGAAASAIGGTRTRSVAFAPDATAEAGAIAAFVEGLGTGLHRFDRFRSASDRPAPPGRLTVLSTALRPADAARTDRVVEAVNRARDLADTPGNHLTPTQLAEHARSLAAETPGLRCTVLDRARLARLGAGALLGVARGSAEPPRMIVLRYAPPARPRGGAVLGLVGKAVTFDSGGISIKPAASMEEMKMDMAGGAAVIEATALIAALGVPQEVLAVVPATENMPSGSAQKPGDVVTAMNGTTIEVINTDAEGRLILADALTYAARNGATRLIDMATLTGAVVVALGEVYAGVMGSDEEWTRLVREAAGASGDMVWPLPMHARYRKLLDSKVADIANVSNKRQAGAILGAEFLRGFAEGLPWAHVDIAGTGMVGGRGTGFGVRLALAVAERMAAAAA